MYFFKCDIQQNKPIHLSRTPAGTPVVNDVTQSPGGSSAQEILTISLKGGRTRYLIGRRTHSLQRM